MRRALHGYRDKIAPETASILEELFEQMGRHDVLAQIRAIELAETRLQAEIEHIHTDKLERCKAYRTIGICTGLAVAVILI